MTPMPHLLWQSLDKVLLDTAAQAKPRGPASRALVHARATGAAARHTHQASLEQKDISLCLSLLGCAHRKTAISMNTQGRPFQGHISGSVFSFRDADRDKIRAVIFVVAVARTYLAGIS